MLTCVSVIESSRKLKIDFINGNARRSFKLRRFYRICLHLLDSYKDLYEIIILINKSYLPIAV